MLSPGTQAPDFELPDQHGEPARLSDFAGKWVLLWWYPKAATPGWTIQGQGLRDKAQRFDELNAVILGASFDTPEENVTFADDQKFPFRLLSDSDRKVGAQYQVARDPEEKFSEFARRYAYLIDPDGVIRAAYDVTDVAAHADAVLADIERLSE